MDDSMENDSIGIALDSLENDASMSDDDEGVSAQKVLQVLEDSWLNEKFSPELLKHKADYVDCMVEQIAGMEANLTNVKKTDFRAEVHLMELARIRYIITSYLRKRLEKIEQFALHILEQDQQRGAEESFLSDEEKLFAEQYLALNENHFNNLVLRHMPPHFRDFRSKLATVIPNYSSHVFLRANKDVPGVVLTGDNSSDNRFEEIDLDKGSQHILQYKNVASLVKDGSVQLI